LSFVVNSLGTSPNPEVLSSQYIGVETLAVENGLGYIIDRKVADPLTIDKLLASSYLQSSMVCTGSTGKFCGFNSLFDPLFKFHQFEGSIALFQNGIFISQDETRGQFLNSHPSTCTGY
jgi:hypothetical protein